MMYLKDIGSSVSYDAQNLRNSDGTGEDMEIPPFSSTTTAATTARGKVIKYEGMWWQMLQDLYYYPHAMLTYTSSR